MAPPSPQASGAAVVRSYDELPALPVVVRFPASGGAVADLRAEAAGGPAILVEVDLDGPDALRHVAAAVAAHPRHRVSVVLRGPDDPDDVADRGAWIGRLAAALDLGATVVRTPAVVPARRIAEVAARMAAARGSGARMAT